MFITDMMDIGLMFLKAFLFLIVGNMIVTETINVIEYLGEKGEEE